MAFYIRFTRAYLCTTFQLCRENVSALEVVVRLVHDLPFFPDDVLQGSYKSILRLSGLQLHTRFNLVQQPLWS